eukprot:352853-Chlamydomonas_euryale.AAC.5
MPQALSQIGYVLLQDAAAVHIMQIRVASACANLHIQTGDPTPTHLSAYSQLMRPTSMQSHRSRMCWPGLRCMHAKNAQRQLCRNGWFNVFVAFPPHPSAQLPHTYTYMPPHGLLSKLNVAKID